MRCVKLRSGAACFGASSFKQNGLTWCTCQRCHSRCKCCAVQLGCAQFLAGAHRVSTTPDDRLLSLRGSEEWDSVVRQALSLRQGRPRQLVRRTGVHPPPMGWYGGTVVRRLRHRQMSEALRQPVPVGGYAPVLLAGCLVRPCLGDNPCLTTESCHHGRPLRLRVSPLGAWSSWRLEVGRRNRSLEGHLLAV